MSFVLSLSKHERAHTSYLPQANRIFRDQKISPKNKAPARVLLRYQANASSAISSGAFSFILIASQRALTVVKISLVKNFAEAIRPL